MEKKTNWKALLGGFACIAALAYGAVIMAAFSGTSAGHVETFSWFIPKTDGYGEYYDIYEQSIPVQWLNSQTWDVENHTLAAGGGGDGVVLSFQVPIAGAEKDYLGTMIGGGDYADLIDLTYATDSAQQMVQDGILLELTEYVEAYMPAYIEYLDANPDVKELATVLDESGKTHYYALYQVNDIPNDNFMGYVYRRDWVVAYADVPQYVWDLDTVLRDPDDPTSVDTSKIHYTDYYEAMENNDWTGWVPQTAVTQFTSSDGAAPDNTYTDNVIFPSGKNKPVYISDWEWMFRAFKEAILAEGLQYDSSAYCTTLYYEGVLGTGDLYSSFGGGNPFWYYTTDTDGNKSAQFGLDSDNMRAYLEAMSAWYDNRWVDTQFEQRSSDMFYKINLTGFSEGKVGLTQAGMAYPGTTIRETQHAGKTTDAMLLGCSLPINDKYGSEENRFVTPDSMYAASKIGSATGISTAAEDKNLPALFTMLNWLYTEEGSLLTTYGLSAEQYASMEFENDYYAAYGITAAYTYDETEDCYYYCEQSWNDTNLQGALNAQRLVCSLMLNGKKGNIYSNALRSAMDEWRLYENTTDITKYSTFMTAEQSNIYSNRLSRIQTYMDQNLPGLIKGGLTDEKWASFQTIIGKYDYQAVNDVFDDIFATLR